MGDYLAARGWAWSKIRAEKLRDNRRTNAGRCEAALSGCLGVAEEVHHDVARVDGGTHNDKLLALCSACHYRLTTELVRQRAQARAAARKEAKRRNHPGRKDRHARIKSNSERLRDHGNVGQADGQRPDQR